MIKTIEQKYGRETDRLQFIEDRDGLKKAELFALQGIKSYRRNVLSIKGHVHKRKLIESYLCFKKFYHEKG